MALEVKRTGKERATTNHDRKTRLRKKVLLGWKNYDITRARYIPVRTSKGGGSRTENFSCDATKQIIIDKMKSLFFHNGRSAIGSVSEFNFQLGNFKGDIIDENSEGLFQLTEYINLHKLSKTRLYLMTKKISVAQLLRKFGKDDNSDDDFEGKTISIVLCSLISLDADKLL